MSEKGLKQLLNQEDFKQQLTSLGIHPTEAHGLFKLLDGDQSGVVSIEEFLSGCLRLKGTAKAVDMITLLFENAKLSRKVERIRKMLDVVPCLEDEDLAQADILPGAIDAKDAFRADSPAYVPVVGDNDRNVFGRDRERPAS